MSGPLEVPPVVGIVMGSDSDWPTMRAAAEACEEFDVPYEAHVVSAHRMPDELRQARWMLKERQDFIDKTKREAEDILDAGRAQAERMVQRTEVVRAAEMRARKIVEAAENEARRMKLEVEDFCDQRLASFEILLERTLKTVTVGREKLNGRMNDTRPPAPPEPESNFFDQDVY